MATGLQTWSKTAATNATADSAVNWAEGMAPSAVNDSARAEMASAAKYRDDNNASLVTSGSTTAYTVTSNQGSTAATAGYTISVQFHATNDSSATLNVDGVTALPMQIVQGTNLVGGEFQIGTKQSFTCSTGSTAWIARSYITAPLSTGTVTYSKIQLENTGSILGNAQGLSFPPQEIVLGTGLVLSTTSTSTGFTFSSTSTSTAIPYTLTAPAFPPTAAFKNLSIKVTGTSSATAIADFATLATSGSTNFQTLALSGNINLGTNGAVNALDTGSLASNTWYAIWGIATASATGQGFLASTSFTSPLLPSGYTYKGRLGALITSTSTASAQLMGTYQFGRKAQYVLGVAATSIVPIMGHGTAGTYSISSPVLATLSTTNFVPQTASTIYGIGFGGWKGGSAANVIVAPNTSWGGSNNGSEGSNGNIMPVDLANVGVAAAPFPFTMILETSNIAWASGNTGGAVACMGWEDNI